jgi:P pilus assembly chaperone PapD
MKDLLFSFNSRSQHMNKGCSSLMSFLMAISICLSFFLAAEESYAQGALQVLPTRVVFEGRTRSAQVSLINQGTETAIYRISFKNMRMTESGGYEDIKEPLPGEIFAKDFIRYSPRRVEIAPGASQTVRLLLRKNSDLPPGEYRSHMLFRSVPPKNSGKDIESLASDDQQLKISLVPVFGITIPVIVRHGKISATAKLEDLKVYPSEKKVEDSILSLRIDRQGTRSLFGDLSVKFTPENSGDTLEVGRLNGIAVFTPNNSRKLNFKLTPPKGIELKRGTITVAYNMNDGDGNKVLAEKQLNLP